MLTPPSLIGNPAQISSSLIFSPGLIRKVASQLKVLFNCLTSENFVRVSHYSPAKVQGYAGQFLLVHTKG